MILLSFYSLWHHRHHHPTNSQTSFYIRWRHQQFKARYGYWMTEKRLHNWGYTSTPICKVCLQDDETDVHILTCSGVTRPQLRAQFLKNYETQLLHSEILSTIQQLLLQEVQCILQYYSTTITPRGSMHFTKPSFIPIWLVTNNV